LLRFAGSRKLNRSLDIFLGNGHATQAPEEKGNKHDGERACIA
jgi:hypothetical protein